MTRNTGCRPVKFCRTHLTPPHALQKKKKEREREEGRGEAGRKREREREKKEE